MTKWLAVENPPCQWCAVWIGPHVHSLRDDGSLGILVEKVRHRDDGTWEITDERPEP